MRYQLNPIFRALAILLLCMIPVIYLAVFSQNRYTSKAQFTVIVEEGSNAEASIGFMSLIGGSSGKASDTQAAIGFIQSADLLLELEKEFNLIDHYTAPESDFIFRLKKSPKREERLKYYREKITAHQDTKSGIISLTIETFSPELSLKLSQSILKKTELFINNLNKDIASKKFAFAKSELQRAQNSIHENQKKLLDFQNKHKIIQPQAIIQARLEAIQSLHLEKVRKEISLATISATSPNSPMSKSLNTTIKNLEKEIKKQERDLSGEDNMKLNKLLLRYTELTLNLELASTLRKGAELILEKTKTDAIATSRFFALIQTPYLPDEHSHPRRIYLSISSVIIILLMLFIAQAAIASVYDRV